MFSLSSIISIVKAMGLATLFWVVVEVVYYLIATYYIYPRINQLTTPPEAPLGAHETIKRVMDACAVTKEVYNFEKLVQGWFKGANAQDVYEDNWRSLIAWAGWHRHYHQLDDNDKAVIDENIAYIKHIHGFTFRPGFNPNVHHVAFTLEPTNVAHVPLLPYAINAMVAFIAGMYLRYTGFTRYTTSHGITYWYRPAAAKSSSTSSSSDLLPLLFFHGIGTGLWMYLPFLCSVCGTTRACLFVEVRHITTTLSLRVPHWTHVVKAVEDMSTRHGINHFCVMGHSFGTMMAGWVARELPHVVSKLVLVDPAALLLGFPEVAGTFLYRKPKKNAVSSSSSSSFKSSVDLSREPTVAHTLRRHFWWYENALWAEDIRCPVVVALSGKDRLVPSAAVKVYMEKMLLPGQSRILWWPKLGHAQVLMCNKLQDQLTNAMNEDMTIAVATPTTTTTNSIPHYQLSAQEAQQLVMNLTESITKRISHPKRVKAAYLAAANWQLAIQDVPDFLHELEPQAPPPATTTSTGAFNARRKLRVGMLGVLAANRFRRASSSSSLMDQSVTDLD